MSSAIDDRFCSIFMHGARENYNAPAIFKWTTQNFKKKKLSEKTSTLEDNNQDLKDKKKLFHHFYGVFITVHLTAQGKLHSITFR